MSLIKVKHIIPYYKIHNLCTSKADKGTILVEMYNFLISLGLVLDKDFDLYYVEEAFYSYTQAFLDNKIVPTDIQRKIQADKEEKENKFNIAEKAIVDICNEWGLEYNKEAFSIVSEINPNMPEDIFNSLSNKIRDLKAEKQKAKVIAIRDRQINQKKNGIPSKFLELYSETEINVSNWVDMVRKDLNFNPYEIEEYPYSEFIDHYNRMILRQESEEKARKEQERKNNSQNNFPNFPQ